MSFLGFAGPFFELVAYKLKSSKGKKKYTDKKIIKILKYAKANSTYYNKRIPDSLNIKDVLPSTKKDFLDNFDDVVTDKRVTKSVVEEKLSSKSIDGRLFDKYSLALTSGSTGNPAVTVQDKNFMEKDSVASALRGFYFRFPIAVMSAMYGRSVETERVSTNSQKSPLIGSMIHTINSLDPIDDIIKALEKAKPKSITGYTSVISIIADAALEGKLHFKPRIILCSGENVSELDRKKISRAFPKARVSSVYGSTEGGAMGYECKHGHLHINGDMTFIEAVDSDYNPVPDGILSDKVLFTNLTNKVQPFIRYVMDDRVKLYHDCPCGNPDPYIEVEGRNDDILIFRNSDGRFIKYSPRNIQEILEEVSESGLLYFKNYQILQKDETHVEVRLSLYDNVDAPEIFDLVSRALHEQFEKIGVHDVDIFVSDVPFMLTSQTGKCRHVINLNEHNKKLEQKQI